MGEVDVVVVLVTGPDEKTLGSLADELVGEGLAACVNLIPRIRSVYRWDGELRRNDEAMAVIKTRRSALRALEDAVHDLHPYDVPEFLVLPVEAGSAAYVRWVRESTTDKTTDRGPDGEE